MRHAQCHPPPSPSPYPPPDRPGKSNKQATEMVQKEDSPRFYPHLLVVPKPRWRPVIDLRALSSCIHAPRFNRDSKNAVAVHEGQRFCPSMVLSDATLHVPIARMPTTYLCYVIGRMVNSFRPLLSVSTSPPGWLQE
jgi:hypothetical protein